jgi:hypothetical protein
MKEMILIFYTIKKDKFISDQKNFRLIFWGNRTDWHSGSQMMKILLKN